MPRQADHEDRNFDELAARFARNIYGGLKGRVRLAVLNRDFGDYLPIAPYRPMTPEGALDILDAGGGQGQFSLPLARAGHRLTLCDISAAMLAVAQEECAAQGLAVNFRHSPVQSLPSELSYDVILCHALLEWVTEPWQLLEGLLRHLRPGGHLSLIFYNWHALVYKNLLRTHYKALEADTHSAFRGSLTPINPLRPEQLLEQLQNWGLEVLCHSGIRVFHDYILDPQARKRDPETLLALELNYSRQEPYRGLGRYVHLLVRKPESASTDV